jgi:ribosomal protein S18 acetylase RimI-like enzyme
MWAVVEAARNAGTLPGIVAEDASGIRGWAFFLVNGDALHLGALVADSSDVSHAILERVLSAPEAAQTDTAFIFVPEVAPGLSPLLADRGFASERYRYLSKRITPLPISSVEAPAWSQRTVNDVAALLARAYPRVDPLRSFAPLGTFEQWREYVTGLFSAAAYGEFLPACSVLQLGADATRLEAVVMATRIGARTAHLPQVAVDPAAQGRGVGRQAVSAALDHLAQRGFSGVTLLVAEGNSKARRLYDRLGFNDTGAFISAVRRQPRRSNSAA